MGKVRYPKIMRKKHRAASRDEHTVPAAPLSPQTAEPEVLHLQRLIGNQATQRLLQAKQSPSLIQRDGAAPNLGLNLQDAMRMQAKREAPVLQWLEQNRAEVVLSSTILNIIRLIRVGVPEAQEISNNDLEAILSSWVTQNHIPLTLNPSQANGKPITDGDASKAALSGLSLQAKTKIGTEEGTLTINTSGATAELMNQAKTKSQKITVTPGGAGGEVKRGGATVSGEVTWKGEVKFGIKSGDYNFEATIKDDKWQLELSIGSEGAPDLSKLSEIFRQGESSMRDMMAGVLRVGNVQDIQRIMGNPLKNVKESVSTVSKIASAGDFSAKLSISGPMRNASPNDPTAGAGGVTIQGTLSFKF